jgi:hypothetical protein
MGVAWAYGAGLCCNAQGYESGMEATTAAALVLGIIFILLAGGVLGWALRDLKHRRHEQRVIDLRDWLEPHVSASPKVKDSVRS